MNIAGTCGTCPHFNPSREENSDAIVKGDCRVRPPVTHMLVIPAPVQGAARIMQGVAPPQPAIMGQTLFPVVQVDAWCSFHPDRAIGGGLVKAIETLSA